MTNKHRPLKSRPRTVSQTLATTLIRRIIDGDYPPGTQMPTERDMANHFQVSRHVVREALKHLEALELIDIQQGSGVYVNDILVAGGMEIFEYMLFDDLEHFSNDAFRDLLVFCRLFMPNVLRLAAKNRTNEHIEELRQTLTERPALLTDTAGLSASNMRLLRCISRATGNRIYQLIFNNIGRLVMRLRSAIPIDALAPVVTQTELEHILRAIETSDAELAGLLAQRFAEKAQKAVSEFLTMTAVNSPMPHGEV